MAEKSYTMDDLSLVKTEETVPLKRRSSQGDQPSRDNVSMILHEVNVTFGNELSQIFKKISFKFTIPTGSQVSCVEVFAGKSRCWKYL